MRKLFCPIMTGILLVALAFTTWHAVTLAHTFASIPVQNYAQVTTASKLDSILEAGKGSHLLIDLRDSKDYDAAYILSFLNSPRADSGETLAAWIGPYSRDKEVILVCYGGNRSAHAFEQLVLMGFTQIVDFTPGYAAYTAEKGESFKPETGGYGCVEK